MNKLDLITKIYARLHNYHGIPYWLLTPLRKIVRFVANTVLPNYLKNSKKVLCEKQTEIIVSLTSFPARINDVWQVVECMKRQTYCPKKIILWLSKEQFQSIDSIPNSLTERVDDIFEIRLVEGDIRSHKKYLYVSREYSDRFVLLIDDDLYYPTDMIKNMEEELQRSGNMVSMYATHIQYKNDHLLSPYSTWKDEYNESYTDDLFFGSGGGFLFKPSDMYKDCLDIKLALRLCPTADDIWLNAMVRLNNKSISKIKFGLILPILSSFNDNRLCEINVDGGANDRQINAVNAYYFKQLGRKVF